MKNTQESSADIIAEIRDLSEGVKQGQLLPTAYGKPLDIYFAALADRLEAALKHEKAAIEADALAVGGIVEASRHKPGNAAAMREALRACFGFIMRLDRAFNPFMQKLLEDAITKAKAALAKPPRNCDVGTAEEQAKRFAKYCQNISFKSSCNGCPLNDNNDDPSCFNLWAQMPYEEGGMRDEEGRAK